MSLLRTQVEDRVLDRVWGVETAAAAKLDGNAAQGRQLKRNAEPCQDRRDEPQDVQNLVVGQSGNPAAKSRTVECVLEVSLTGAAPPVRANPTYVAPLSVDTACAR